MKEPGDATVSDALTKPVEERRLTKLPMSMVYEFRDGRNMFRARGTVTKGPEEMCNVSSAVRNFSNVFWITRASRRAMLGSAHV